MSFGMQVAPAVVESPRRALAPALVPPCLVPVRRSVSVPLDLRVRHQCRMHWCWVAVGVRGQVGLLAVVEALVVLTRRRRHCWAAVVMAAAILHGLPAAVAVASVRARRRRTSPHTACHNASFPR